MKRITSSGIIADGRDALCPDNACPDNVARDAVLGAVLSAL
jgi:hypothetical protein